MEQARLEVAVQLQHQVALMRLRATTTLTQMRTTVLARTQLRQMSIATATALWLLTVLVNAVAPQWKMNVAFAAATAFQQLTAIATAPLS